MNSTDLVEKLIDIIAIVFAISLVMATVVLLAAVVAGGLLAT